jgi:MFS family permease
VRGEEPNEAGRLGPEPPVLEGRPSLLRRVAVDVTPLRRHRDFRLLFAGQAVSFLGSMVTFVAIPFQVYDLTGSTLLVGLLALAELGPILAAALLGGALADAYDRRRLVQLSELALALCAGILLANSLAGEPRVWVLFVVAALMGALDGLQRPSLEAMTPRLVDRDEIPAAAALSGLRWQFGMIAGPALAGVLIGVIGLPATYGLDVGTYAVSLLFLRLMRSMPPPEKAERPSLAGILEGLRYAWSRPVLMGTYFVDIVAMVFGMSAALFPAFAAEFGRPEQLGLMYTALAVGSLVATLTSGWTRRVHRHGLAVIIAALGWGVAVVGFGLAPGIGVALLCLGAAGFADMVSGIFRTTIWNQTIPDHLRGRLAGIEQISYTSGPLLGNVEAGVVAAGFGVRASAVSGGILCIIGVGAVAAWLPALRRYDASSPARPRA